MPDGSLNRTYQGRAHAGSQVRGTLSEARRVCPAPRRAGWLYVKRETGGWKMPLVMAGCLFALAYPASFVTCRLALAPGAG